MVAFIADGATSSLAAHGEQGLADQSHISANAETPMQTGG
jgi:hypothetical protein